MIYVYILTHKQLEMHGCVLSTVAADALVLKHQAVSSAQFWLNINCMKQILFRNVIFIMQTGMKKK